MAVSKSPAAAPLTWIAKPRKCLAPNPDHVQAPGRKLPRKIQPPSGVATSTGIALGLLIGNKLASSSRNRGYHGRSRDHRVVALQIQQVLPDRPQPVCVLLYVLSLVIVHNPFCLFLLHFLSLLPSYPLHQYPRGNKRMQRYKFNESGKPRATEDYRSRVRVMCMRVNFTSIIVYMLRQSFAKTPIQNPS